MGKCTPLLSVVVLPLIIKKDGASKYIEERKKGKRLFPALSSLTPSHLVEKEHLVRRVSKYNRLFWGGGGGGRALHKASQQQWKKKEDEEGVRERSLSEA